VNDCVRPLSARGKSVKDDWRAWLPEAKTVVFNKQVHRLESNYVMLSVSLNEAIELRQLGQPGKSMQAVGITSGLCRLLTQTLAGLLRALSEHAKHYGTIPNAAPFDPANFQGQKGQRSARMSNLLNHVLLSHRLQFLHKVGTLVEMVEDLGKDFRHAAEDLAEGLTVNPKEMWDEVDTGHYDLPERGYCGAQIFLDCLARESARDVSRHRSRAIRAPGKRLSVPPGPDPP